MSLYVEGDVPYVANGNNCNNGGMFGNDGWWGIILIALLFGWGRGGYGNGFGGSSSWEGSFGFQLGKLATQEDVASGFTSSSILSSLNDLKLGQSSGFAGVQQTLCQGFSGVNTALLQGFAGVDNAICTLGYQNQQGFNALGQQIAQCCCDLKTMNLENRYLNEKQTCEIVNAINMGNQRLVDIYTNDKIDTLNRKLATAEAQLSNNAQSRYITDTILDKLSPCPKPAFLTCNPATGLTFPQGFNNNGCCGCGSF